MGLKKKCLRELDIHPSVSRCEACPSKIFLNCLALKLSVSYYPNFCIDNNMLPVFWSILLQHHTSIVRKRRFSALRAKGKAFS